MAILDKTQSRIVPQHKTEAEWLKEENKDFCPKPGEIIIFDSDETYNYARFKVGDGQHNLSELEFSSGAANGKGQNSLQVGQVETYPTEALGDYSLAVGYNKNDIATKSIGIASAAIGKGVQSYGEYSFVTGCQNFTGLTEEEKERAYQYAGIIKDQETQKYRIMTEDELLSTKESTKKNIQLPTKSTTTPITYTLNIADDLTLDIAHAYKAETYQIKPWTTSIIPEANFEAGYIFGTLGQNAISGGYGNRSVGQSAFSHGQGNMALGNRTFALGTNNKANSKENIAIGTNNVIGQPLYYDGKENNIIAIGNNLTSHTSNQIVLGQHNKEDSEAILIIGNGSSANKKNIFSLSNNILSYGQVSVAIEDINITQYYKQQAYYNNSKKNFVLILNNDSNIITEQLKNRIVKIKIQSQTFFFSIDTVWINSYNGNGLVNQSAIRLVLTTKIGSMSNTEYDELKNNITNNPSIITDICVINLENQSKLLIKDNTLLYNGNINIKENIFVNNNLYLPDNFIENIWS